MRDINKEIEDFIESIKDLWESEPLDGDATENISLKVQLKLDILMGNIIQEEFENQVILLK